MSNNPPVANICLNGSEMSTAVPSPVVFWPDTRLNTVCVDVTEDQLDRIQKVLAAMFATMKQASGIGLAAPQIGLMLNVITLNIPEVLELGHTGTQTPTSEPISQPFVMINPAIVEQGDDQFRWEEGCLSVPGHFEYRNRPQRIVVEYLNDDGSKHRTEFTGLHAFAIQHEMDHLVGKIFVDELSGLKQSRIKKKIRKTLNRR